MMFGDPSDEERCPYCGKFPVIGPPGCCSGDSRDTEPPVSLYQGPDTDSLDTLWSVSVDVEYTRIVRETERAWQLEMPDGGVMWFPKSRISKVSPNGGYFKCPAWLANQKGLTGREQHESALRNSALRQEIRDLRRRLAELESFLDD